MYEECPRLGKTAEEIDNPSHESTIVIKVVSWLSQCKSIVLNTYQTGPRNRILKAKIGVV